MYIKLLQFFLECLLLLEKFGIESYFKRTITQVVSVWGLIYVQENNLHRIYRIPLPILRPHFTLFYCCFCLFVCVCVCVLTVSEVYELPEICSHGLWDILRRWIPFASQISTHHSSHLISHTVHLLLHLWTQSFAPRCLLLHGTTRFIVRPAFRLPLKQ